MAYSANAGGIPQGILEEVFEGLQGEDKALVDEAGEAREVSEQAGKIFVEESFTSLPQNKSGGLAEGVSYQPEEAGFTSVSYDCLRHGGARNIPDGVRLTLANGYNYDAIERFLGYCRKDGIKSLNALLNSRIIDTNLNETQAAGAVWTDEGAASTPIADMQSGARKIGNRPDIAIFGNDVVNGLLRHPNFTSHATMWDGSSAIPAGEFVSILKGLFPTLEYVGLGNGLYNANDPNQSSISLAYDFDGTAWLGHRSELIVCNQMGGESVGQERDEMSEVTGLRYTRRSDILRPHKEGAVVFTSVTA